VVAAQGEAWRELSLNVTKALRARVLAAQRKETLRALPGLLGDRRGADLGGGLFRTEAALQDGSNLCENLGQVDAVAEPGKAGQQMGLGCSATAAEMARSRSAMVRSRVRRSWTWA